MTSSYSTSPCWTCRMTSPSGQTERLSLQNRNERSFHRSRWLELKDDIGIRKGGGRRGRIEMLPIPTFKEANSIAAALTRRKQVARSTRRLLRSSGGEQSRAERCSVEADAETL